MSSSISVGQETGAVAMGPVGCLMMFVSLFMLAAAFYKV